MNEFNTQLCKLFGINCPPPPDPSAPSIPPDRTMPAPPEQIERLKNSAAGEYILGLGNLDREPTIDELQRLRRMLIQEQLPSAALVTNDLLQSKLQTDLQALHDEQSRLQEALRQNLAKQVEMLGHLRIFDPE